jgi:hypothetical protein
MENMMGWQLESKCVMKNAGTYKILIGSLNKRYQHGRSRRRWKDNINICFEEEGRR